MELIPVLGEVMPDYAPESLQRVYASIRQTLRVPFVNFIFRVLANRPDYLEAAWGHVRPKLTTVAFERAANTLRAQALLEDVGQMVPDDWRAGGSLGRIRSFTETIHYVLPKLLLVATAWDEAGAPDWPAAWKREPVPSDRFPEGVAEGAVSIDLIDPKQVDGRLHALFADIRETHRHPGVASYYRALGHWPDFLDTVWQRVKPCIDTPAYEHRKRALIDQARLMVQDLSLYGPAFKDPEQAALIRQILAVFRFRLIPDLLLDVTVVKCLFEGPERAWQSRLRVVSGFRPH